MENTMVNVSEKTEMEKLIDWLSENLDSSKFNLKQRYINDGLQVLIFDSKGVWLWDAICNCMSYGHERGLIEVMEHTDKNYILTEEERSCDDVLGWLTAEQIIERLEGKSSE